MDWWSKPGDVVQFKGDGDFGGCYGTIIDVQDVDGEVVYTVAIPMPYTDPIYVKTQASKFYDIGEKVEE